MNTLQLLLLGEYRLHKSYGSTDYGAQLVATVTVAHRFSITHAHAQLELDAALRIAQITPALYDTKD